VPIQFAFDAENGILLCEFSGRLNDKGLMDYQAEAKKRAKQVKARIMILEFKNITSVDVSMAGISLIAKAAPAARGAGKPRIIVAPTELIYGKSRAFEMLAEGSRPGLRIVRSRKEAYALLNIPEPTFEPIG